MDAFFQEVDLFLCEFLDAVFVDTREEYLRREPGQPPARTMKSSYIEELLRSLCLECGFAHYVTPLNRTLYHRELDLLAQRHFIPISGYAYTRVLCTSNENQYERMERVPGWALKWKLRRFSAHLAEAD